jgi:uncharacterized protein YlzI (FlbEa/FlbD family)
MVATEISGGSAAEMAQWAALHLNVGNEETFVNADAVMRIQQLSDGATKVVFWDGREIVVRESATDVIEIFRSDA